MGPFLVVYVTVGSVEEGEKLATALVEERLAACVNRVGPIRSTYRWEGKLEHSDEELLIIKTRSDLFDQLKNRVQALHSYSVPEIIALPIVDGSEGYLRWLGEETGGERKK
jgi:periplasmic divalent cation tolerance protein